MKMRIETGKPLNLNDQLNAISKGLLIEPQKQCFPTPRASSGNGAGIHGQGGIDLQTTVRLWPTPTAFDWNTPVKSRIETRSKSYKSNLKEAVMLWPTPRAGNPGSRPNKKGGKILSEEAKKSVWPTPTGCGNYNRKGISEKSGDGLETAVKKYPTPTVQDYKPRGPNSNQQGLADVVRFWATPTANDAKNSITESQAGRGTLTAHLAETGEAIGGQLNADWVEILMGYPLFWTDIRRDKVYGRNLPASWLDGTWEVGIPRVITGQKNRVKRLKGLGNAVVPQIPELIFLLIARFL